MLVASEAIAAGNLRLRVTASGPLEVRKLGMTFNRMADGLELTLDKLAQRSSLAAVGEFAAALSHEVRNALTSLRVDLQRGARRPIEDPTVRAMIDRSLKKVGRMDAAVTGALRMARGDRVQAELVDLTRIITSAVETVVDVYGSDSFEVRGTMDTLETVRGDAAAMEQLLVNILLNARQASPPDGTVRVSITNRPGRALIRVSDDGAGMTPQQIERALEPFTSSRRDGTGLGLPIACQIAAAHGGELTIESEPGRGTTVCIGLPTDV